MTDENDNGEQMPVTSADEAAAISILRGAITRTMGLVGPEATARHLALAFAGHIAGGGYEFAAQMLHFAHDATTSSLHHLEKKKSLIQVVPASIIKPS